MTDIIQKAIKKLPPVICFNGIEFSCEIIHCTKEFKLCYDINTPGIEIWANPFRNGSCNSFLYLVEGITSVEDLENAINDTIEWLDHYKIYPPRIEHLVYERKADLNPLCFKDTFTGTKYEKQFLKEHFSTKQIKKIKSKKVA